MALVASNIAWTVEIEELARKHFFAPQKTCNVDGNNICSFVESGSRRDGSSKARNKAKINYTGKAEGAIEGPDGNARIEETDGVLAQTRDVADACQWCATRDDIVEGRLTSIVQR